ncbi:MAG: VWA domain-containing protein, partial [Myxococcales bacterium]|nr:VWA domain-containing protein [Myxococcales bacterium]
DDSMSLASAQRLIYAVKNGIGYSVPQIRPHELLNYFSFDTVTPDADQTFDVLASATQDGDQLTLALAVKGATPQRQALDLTVLVDRSCSMEGEGRMDYTQRSLHLMADQLETGDRVDLVLFDDRTCVPLENFVVGRDDPALLQKTIDQMRPEGATDVDMGLREAYRVAKAHADTRGRNRRMMVMTDAMMNTGDIDPNTVSEIGKAFENDGIRLTGVGVGSEFNDEVLDRLTEKGKGAYVFLGSEAVVDRLFGPSGFPSLTQTIAHDVRFRLELPDSLAMERFYGEEASTNKEDVQPINYYAGTSQLFLQDLRLRDGRVVPNDPVEMVVEYRDARTGEPETRTFRTTVGKMLKADQHNARKGMALMAWTDLLTADAMGADPCGDPLRTYARRASTLSDDAEVGFVNGLVRQRCGNFELPSVVTDNGVPFKVKVDSDIPISTVALDCGGSRSTEALSGSDVIAMITAPAGGVCELTLSGTVDMRAEVEVPVTGGDLRCVIRGGRVHCS